MSEGSPKKPPPPPRPKPPVPTSAKPTPPPLEEGNPFLPLDSWSKISSSKIDAAWEAPDEAAPTAPKPVTASPAPPPPAAKVDPTPEPPPVKKSRGGLLAFVFVLVVLGGAGFAYQSQLAAPPAKIAAPETAQTTAEPVVTAEPPPPPTFTAETPPSASVASKPATTAAVAANIDPEFRAFLDATQLPPGRKLVVDGRVVGTSPRKVAIRCGTHRIQIGDQDPETVDFPCGGGEVNFTE